MLGRVRRVVQKGCCNVLQRTNVTVRSCPVSGAGREKTIVERGVASALLLLLSASAAATWASTSECESAQGKHSAAALLTRNTVADLVETVAPAVVNIVCSAGYGGIAVSSGSGFILNREGFIVTNAHVIADSYDKRCVVTFYNGKKKTATIHSIDKLSDIALIRLDDIPADLRTVSLGHSSMLRAGEFVIAIGSPAQLTNSVSLGIVSATARHSSELGISNNRAEYIQTDTAVNRGNSGGPLINLDGEVIGINTIKMQGTDGISFAIPMDMASDIIQQLMTDKKATRPYVGLKMANYRKRDMTNNKESTYSSSNGKTALFYTGDIEVAVVDVIRGSPAHLSGIERGDFILEIDNKPAASVRDVLTAIGHSVGKSVTLKIRKSDGREQSVTLVTTAAPGL